MLPDWTPRLTEALAHRPGPVEVSAVAPLVGGACQENFRVDLITPSGPVTQVLRSDANASLSGSLDRATEAAVIRAAVAAGVPTPAVHEVIADLLRPDSHAYLMDWADGVAIGRKIVADPRLEGARQALPEQLGRALAAIHSVTPTTTHLQLDNVHSAGPHRGPVDAMLGFLRSSLEGLPEPRPAAWLGLRWLEEHRPADDEVVLVHGDYRTGNFLVDEQGLVAVLDWEFAHWGSPEDDLAWISVRDWRFGRLDQPVGGFGQREPFYAAYEAASGRRVDRDRVHWWEVAGNLRWAVGAVEQGERYLSGQDTDLELLAIARRAAEMEYEALRLCQWTPR